MRNVAAIIIGFAAASLVNMAIITLGSSLIAPPANADMNTIEGIRAAMPRMAPIQFLMPFLAHAVGTLAGAFAAALTAASHKMRFALAIGVIFLASGVAMVSMVGGPLWFIAADLILAYLPMAWLGGRMGMGLTGNARVSRTAVVEH
ncbi:MAG TPA: hypothetical protein VF846_19790 [Thermoanaerobaculia bacterium]